MTEVVGVSDTSLDLAHSLTARGFDVPLLFPAVPPRPEVTLTSVQGAGENTQHIDLTTLARATAGSLGLRFEMWVAGPDAPEGPGQERLEIWLDRVSSVRVITP